MSSPRNRGSTFRLRLRRTAAAFLLAVADSLSDFAREWLAAAFLAAVFLVVGLVEGALFLLAVGVPSPRYVGRTSISGIDCRVPVRSSTRMRNMSARISSVL